MIRDKINSSGDGKALRPGYYVGKPLFGKLEKLEAGILLKSKKYYHESTGNVNKTWSIVRQQVVTQTLLGALLCYWIAV
jgi:hypothetical protein